MPSPEGTATSIPGSLASSFAILRAPRQPIVDSLPPDGVVAITTPGGIGGHYGANPVLSRYAGSIDGTSFWLVPGDLGSCVYTSNAGTICTSNARMSSQGTQGLIVPDAGGADTFLGVVSDNAGVIATNNDGSQASVSRSGDAYIVSGDPNLHSVTVREANGQDQTSAVPQTPPPS